MLMGFMIRPIFFVYIIIAGSLLGGLRAFSWEISGDAHFFYQYSDLKNQLPFDSQSFPYLIDKRHLLTSVGHLEAHTRFFGAQHWISLGLEQAFDLYSAENQYFEDLFDKHIGAQGRLFRYNLHFSSARWGVGQRLQLMWQYRLDQSNDDLLAAKDRRLKLTHRIQQWQPYGQWSWNKQHRSQVSFPFYRNLNVINPERSQKNLIWHDGGSYQSLMVSHALQLTDRIELKMHLIRQERLFQDFWFDHTLRIFAAEGRWNPSKKFDFLLGVSLLSLDYWQPRLSFECGSKLDGGYGRCERRVEGKVIATGVDYRLNPQSTLEARWKRVESEISAVHSRKLQRNEFMIEFEWVLENESQPDFIEPSALLLEL